jgi:hypothetical protein
VDQFASRKTRTSLSEDTGGWTQPDGGKKGPLGSCLFLTSQVMCLRESCMRENRTCSLSGGRRLARKRASSDPTHNALYELLKRDEISTTGGEWRLIEERRKAS